MIIIRRRRFIARTLARLKCFAREPGEKRLLVCVGWEGNSGQTEHKSQEDETEYGYACVCYWGYPRWPDEDVESSA